MLTSLLTTLGLAYAGFSALLFLPHDVLHSSPLQKRNSMHAV